MWEVRELQLELQHEGAQLWAGGGGEEALVLWLRKGARGGGGPHETQEVRALPGKAAKLWSAIG